MDSSDDADNKSINPIVGGLVWVRRRNGSWWPGRIMGLDELPEDCLGSARSGTPIKLLGRDDASVDWYNLDRSKRVKAFRCGEYDGCIEKAKAAANANKKAAKYARREDAILHALELENVRQIDDEPDFCSRMENSGNERDGSSCKDSPTMFHSASDSDDSDDVSVSEDTSTSAQELSQSGISFEEPKHINVPMVQSVQGSRRRTPDDSEDDETKGIKRMRGLDDLGLGEMSKRKIQDVEIHEEVLQDNALVFNGKMPSLKRQRLQVAHVHEFLKRKNRRRTLTKVLESTDLVNVPVMYPKSTFCGVSNKLFVLEFNETNRNISGVINNSLDSTCASFEHESDVSYSNKLNENGNSSMFGYLANDCPDGLFDVPFVEEGKYSAGRQSGHEYQLEDVLLTHGGFTKSEPAIDYISQRIEKSTSKWQSKGKRNSRHTCKKSMKHELENFVDTDKILFDTSQNPQRSHPYHESQLSIHLKYQTDDYPNIDLEPELFLYDVVVEVKANYRPQHVPLVSLMSKLNGKAIIGHPLTVEVIEEGASDQFVKMSVMAKGQLVFTEKSKKYARSAAARFSHSKPPKARKGSLLLKKTRKLSSLTRCQKISEENRKPVVEKFSTPAVACIPLNVVFSQLNAAVSGSARSSPGVLT